MPVDKDRLATLTCASLSSRATPTKEYTFSGIDRSDYTGLYNFLSTKRIRIKNLEGVGMEDAGPEAPVYNEDEIYGVEGGDEEDEEEEDEDYDQAQAVKERRKSQRVNLTKMTTVWDPLAKAPTLKRLERRQRRNGSLKQADDEAPKKKKKKASPKHEEKGQEERPKCSKTSFDGVHYLCKQEAKGNQGRESRH